MTVEPDVFCVIVGAAALLGWFTCAMVNGRDRERFDTARREYEAAYSEWLALHEPTGPLPIIQPRKPVRIGPALRAWAERIRMDIGDWIESNRADHEDRWQGTSPIALVRDALPARERWSPLPVRAAIPVMPTPQQLWFRLARSVPREVRMARAQRWAR